MPDYKWKEIADLPEDLEVLRDRELDSLFEIWRDEHNRVGEQAQIATLNTELAREWAIETGIIEGVYTLDRGTTQILVEHGIDSALISHDATNRDPELVSRIIQAHKDVLEGLFAFVKTERELSAGYIKELHAALMQHVDTVDVFDQFGQPFQMALEKGAYKKLANSPRREDGTLHEYCPPEHVAAEMDRLVDLHRQHERREVRAYVEAAWLHHAFTQIHPFQDGNGRVARTLASLVLIKAGFFPLVVTRDDRERYITALERADGGEIGELVRLFSQLQKRALTKAIGRAVDAKKYATLDESLKATTDLLVNLGRIIPVQYNQAKTTAQALYNSTTGLLTSASEKLSSSISKVDSQFRFQILSHSGTPASEIRTLGEALKYDPNVSYYYQTVQMALSTAEAHCTIAVSFHGIGSAFRGLLAAVPYFQKGDGAPLPLADDIFRISYREAPAEVQKRFEKWLEQAIIEGMAQWRRTLV